MSFIDGDYRDYMKTYDNQSVNPQCTCNPCHYTKENLVATREIPFSVLTELRGTVMSAGYYDIEIEQGTTGLLM